MKKITASMAAGFAALGVVATPGMANAANDAAFDVAPYVNMTQTQYMADMESSKGIGAPRTDCAAANMPATSPQGTIKRKKKNTYTESPLWCGWVYNQSGLRYGTGGNGVLSYDPLLMSPTMTYQKTQEAAGGSGNTPPGWSNTVDMWATTKLGSGTTTPSFASTLSNPLTAFNFGQLGRNNTFTTDSDYRDGWLTVSNMSGPDVLKSQTNGGNLTFVYNQTNQLNGGVCQTDRNSEYLRCNTTNSLQAKRGGGTKGGHTNYPVVGSATGWGVWPTTIRVLNYLPSTMTYLTGKPTGTNIAIDKSVTTNLNQIPAASDDAQYGTSMGAMAVSGYRSDRAATSTWSATYKVDSTSSDYNGVQVSINPQMAKGDDIIPMQNTGGPSPSPTPADTSKWCNVSRSSSQSVSCFVTVSGGMNKTITFHVVPWKP